MVAEELEGLDDLSLLRAVIIGEAEAEPFIGKVAVGNVIANRLGDERWPDSLRGVVLQRWQFSCVLPEEFRPSMVVPYSEERWWQDAHFIAWGLLRGALPDVTEGANHFYADWMETPAWARGVRPTVVINRHVFMRL